MRRQTISSKVTYVVAEELLLVQQRKSRKLGDGDRLN